MTKLRLYHLTQSQATGYDTYSDAVVCAPTPEAARKIHPNGTDGWDSFYKDCWASRPEDVTVRLLGDAALGIKLGVICASFHAG